jgi:beta-galactosidase
VNGTKNVNDGGWHHLAGVYDGNSLTLYVDGVVDASVSSTGSISTNNYDVQIGGNSQSSGREFNGAIYDARVYNRALCPVEIQAMSGGGSAPFGVRIIKWVEIQ